MVESHQTRELKRRMARIVVIVGFLLGGLAFITAVNYRDMSAEIPAFDELVAVEANSFRPEYPLIRRGGGSIEFFDEQEQRFKTPRIGEEDVAGIEEALGRGVPVTIRYGRWLSPFPSTKIFTVYQLEMENSVIIPYERLARDQQRKRDSMIPVLSLSVLISLGAIFLGVRLGLKCGLHASR